MMTLVLCLDKRVEYLMGALSPDLSVGGKYGVHTFSSQITLPRPNVMTLSAWLGDGGDDEALLTPEQHDFMLSLQD